MLLLKGWGQSTYFHELIALYSLEFSWTWMLMLLLKSIASSNGGIIDQVFETVYNQVCHIHTPYHDYTTNKLEDSKSLQSPRMSSSANTLIKSEKYWNQYSESHNKKCTNDPLIKRIDLSQVRNPSLWLVK